MSAQEKPEPLAPAEPRRRGDAEATIRAIERHFRPGALGPSIDGKLDILDPGGAMDRTQRAAEKMGAGEYAANVGNLPPALYFEVRYREAQAEAIRLQIERGVLLEQRIAAKSPAKIADIDEALAALQKQMRAADGEVLRYFKEGSRLAKQRQRSLREIQRKHDEAKERRQKARAAADAQELDAISKQMLEREQAG